MGGFRKHEKSIPEPLDLEEKIVEEYWEEDEPVEDEEEDYIDCPDCDGEGGFRDNETDEWIECDNCCGTGRC